MSTVEEIERAVANLPPEQLAEFRSWFAAFDAEVWDHEFEEDVREGRLDKLADEALRDLDEGLCTDL
jgi:hypothetical protein